MAGCEGLAAGVCWLAAADHAPAIDNARRKARQAPRLEIDMQGLYQQPRGKRLAGAEGWTLAGAGREVRSFRLRAGRISAHQSGGIEVALGHGRAREAEGGGGIERDRDTMRHHWMVGRIVVRDVHAHAAGDGIRHGMR